MTCLVSSPLLSSHLIWFSFIICLISSHLSSSFVFVFHLVSFCLNLLFPLLLIILFYYHFNLILSLTFNCVFTLCRILSSLISSGSCFVLFRHVPSLVLSLLVLFCHLVLYLLFSFNLSAFILRPTYTTFLYVYANVCSWIHSLYSFKLKLRLVFDVVAVSAILLLLFRLFSFVFCFETTAWGQCCHLVEQLISAKQIQCICATCAYKYARLQRVLFCWQNLCCSLKYILGFICSPLDWHVLPHLILSHLIFFLSLF